METADSVVVVVVVEVVVVELDVSGAVVLVDGRPAFVGAAMDEKVAMGRLQYWKVRRKRR